MKEIALSKIHQELGAKMVPFAGYNMPLQYSGLTHEHMAVRNSVGMFDVSHMGRIYCERFTGLRPYSKGNNQRCNEIGSW